MRLENALEGMYPTAGKHWIGEGEALRGGAAIRLVCAKVFDGPFLGLALLGRVGGGGFLATGNMVHREGQFYFHFLD